MNVSWQEILVWVVKCAAIYLLMINVSALMTLAERKFSAWMQYRIGPNRVGPFGLLQPLADGVKFIFKEEVMPDGANKFLFRWAPLIAALPPMLSVAVIPMGGEIVINGHSFGFLSIADLDIGVVYILALGGLAVYGVILGGWASNSKYSLLGGLRASAQMISYELSLILSIVAVVAMSGSLNLREIADQQNAVENWNLWNLQAPQFLGFVLFVISTFAETNRHPFDFAECEPELVGGFHTEYSAMKWAMFFIGEYSAMFVMSALTVTLFLGGPSVPFVEHPHWLLSFVAFFAKTSVFLFLFLWVRWTLPRFRFDQLMQLGWKVMLPLALLNLAYTGAMLALR